MHGDCIAFRDKRAILPCDALNIETVFFFHVPLLFALYSTSLLKSYIWSILLHGCEWWTLTKDLERRLEAAEMWYIRKIVRISWTEKKSNEEVMEIAGYKTSLLKTIRKRQL